MGKFTSPTMPLDVAPIYCAEQIEVPEALPDILKEWSKSVLRASLENREQLYAFSAEYFRNLTAQTGRPDTEFGDLEGKIPLAEFLSSTCMWISANEAAEAFAGVDAIKHSFEHLYTAFGLFDSSKSGVARKEDMCAVLAEVGLQLLPNQVSQIFLQFVPDFDDKSEVTFKEFL